jgi:hypothetical protein
VDQPSRSTFLASPGGVERLGFVAGEHPNHGSCLWLHEQRTHPQAGATGRPVSGLPIDSDGRRRAALEGSLGVGGWGLWCGRVQSGESPPEPAATSVLRRVTPQTATTRKPTLGLSPECPNTPPMAFRNTPRAVEWPQPHGSAVRLVLFGMCSTEPPGFRSAGQPEPTAQAVRHKQHKPYGTAKSTSRTAHKLHRVEGGGCLSLPQPAQLEPPDDASPDGHPSQGRPQSRQLQSCARFGGRRPFRSCVLRSWARIAVMGAYCGHGRS